MNKTKRVRRGVNRGLVGSSAAWVLLASAHAFAQPAPLPAAAKPAAAAQPAAAAAQPAAAAAQPAAAQPTAAAPATSTPPAPKVDPLATALAKQPGGLTLDEVAKLAIKTKPSLRTKQAELAAAAAKVDQAYVNYFPRVTLTGSYTRLSEVSVSQDAPVIGQTASGEDIYQASTGTGVIGAKGTGQVVTAPCQKDPTATCVYTADPNDPTKIIAPVGAAAAGFSFPLVLDTYSFSAQLAVPVSDYLLRITQGHAAASHQEKAKKVELQAETLVAAADAKVAYLNWVRAKGQVVVAKEAVAQATAHVEDVKRLKNIGGLASQADVLRVEAQQAAAEQAVVEVEAFASIAEEQVRIGLGLPKDKALEIGIDVMNVAPPATLPQLTEAQAQALDRRLEIRALDETELSLKEVESVTRAGYYPRLDAVADLTVANPNQRYIFAGAVTNTTWAVGLRASWTINDTFSTIGAAAEAKARTTQVSETKNQVRDGLRLEVAAAYAEIKKSGASIDAATRSLTAAEEGLRVRRELYIQGKATNVEMLDSETDVTRARLRRLDAQIGLLVAQVKYEHALGNDVASQTPPAATTDSAPPAAGDDASTKKPTTVAKATPGPLLPLAR